MPPQPPNWVIGAAAGVAGVALVPVVAPAALGIVGFSAAGPVAGTLAAAIQSGIGNVAAGSAFAVAQSIGMGGAIPTGVYAASSGVFAGVAGWAARRFGGDGPEPDPTLIRKQLNSNSDDEKLDAMKKLIALMSKGRDVSEYFTQVFKNVASQNLEIRQLVYIYLLKYVEQEPDLTLLFINLFQKDLTDSNPLICATALRAVSWFGGDEPDNEPDPSTLIRKQLDSSSDEEKLDAMKKLIALMSKGCNISKYFAQVVKNVASQNLEIRKLVYIYLLKYAEQESDLALLSINMFKKDLADSNPLIRAMALRVLIGINWFGDEFDEPQMALRVASLSSGDEPDPTLIRKQLDSSSDEEKLDAMKRLIALVSKGRDVSEYFAHVVMNVTSENLEIRKLVYIYLLKYAEQKPDLALYFINTFQKDLTDSDPIIRAMALRVLIGINWFGDDFDGPQMALRVASLSSGDEPDNEPDSNTLALVSRPGFDYP